MAAAPRILILASQSPRRLDLLASIGIVPDQAIAPNVDETPLPQEPPRALATRLARAKAAMARFPQAWVLAADTVVAVGRRPLPGPTDPGSARACLMLLSGRKHHVYTAVVLRGPDGRLRERLSETSVTFARLSPDQQDRYIDSGEWHGKAGGYAVQGIAASFVRTLSGSYSGVVGLPLFETAQLLRSHGWRIP
jgi:septum formation protein